jgi:hypothetical protein
VTRPRWRVGAAVLSALAVAGVLAAAVMLVRVAGPAGLPHGAVVLLRGTPYYWVADEAGVLHWAGDTRVLVGRYVRWRDVREVSTAELERLPRGEPWLATPVAFVRAGGRLYLVRWEAGLRWPALLLVPSVEALAVFGITPGAVEARSVDRQTWERLLGLPVDALAAELTPVRRGAEGQEASWGDGAWSGVGTQRSPAMAYPVSLTLTRPTLDPALGVVVGTVEYPSFPCGGRLGLIAAGEGEVHLAERLTSGLEQCTDQGRVVLARRTDQRLFYTWALPDDPLAVTGQLLRTEGQPATAAPTRPGG